MWGLEIKQADCLLKFQKEAEKFSHFYLPLVSLLSFAISYKNQILKSAYKALSEKVPLKIT